MDKTVKYVLKWILAAIASVALALVLSWTIATYIHNNNASYYYYTVNEDGISCTVTGVAEGVGSGHRGLYIPDTLDGYTVTAIADEAFMGNEYAADLRIPETVTYIGARAFKDCINSTMVYIPGSVEYIGESSFEGCVKLRYINVRNGVTALPDNFAKGCTKLEFAIIYDSVVSIGDNAFYDCDAMVNVVINADIEKIGVNAFAECDKLIRLLYLSTEEDWQSVEADKGVTPLVFYYSEQKPAVEGQYWYRDEKLINYIWYYE